MKKPEDQLDIVNVVNCLISLELEILNYIRRKQGKESSPINIYEIAERLVEPKSDVCKAFRQLVNKKALIADGDNFKINENLFKKPADASDVKPADGAKQA